MRKPVAETNGLIELLFERTLNLVQQEGRDFSLRQLAVLLICETNGPQTVRGLAQDLEIAKPAITRAVDKLEDAGLVMRKADPADRRSVLIIVSTLGSEYCANFAGITRRPKLPARSKAKK